MRADQDQDDMGSVEVSQNLVLRLKTSGDVAIAPVLDEAFAFQRRQVQLQHVAQVGVLLGIQKKYLYARKGGLIRVHYDPILLEEWLAVPLEVCHIQAG